MPKRQLSNRLRVLRAERGFSQMETAALARISRDRLWRIENGYMDATEAEREALARIFGVSPAEIFPVTRTEATA